MKMRKKVGLFSVAVIIILCMASISVLGEENGWTCPQCGRTGNTRKFCGGCGSPAPDLEKENQDTSGAGQEATQDFVTIGNVVTFGRYEQDNDLTNGSEDIEWIVLDTDEKHCLLMSKYGLDVKPFNDVFIGTNWENCSIRKWLNDTFLNSAFSAEKQKAIRLNTISDGDQSYTLDHVFLLSLSEVNQYLTQKELRICELTPYAAQQSKNKNRNIGWWLTRTITKDPYVVNRIIETGSPGVISVRDDDGVIRPAIWVQKDALSSLK